MHSQRDRDIVLLDAGGTLITLDFDRVRGVLAPAGVSPDDEALDCAEAGARRWADTAVRKQLAARALWDGYFGRVLRGAGVPEHVLGAALEALWDANRAHGLWRRPVPGESKMSPCRGETGPVREEWPSSSLKISLTGNGRP